MRYCAPFALMIGLMSPMMAAMAGTNAFIRNGDMAAGSTQPDAWELSAYKVGNVALKRDTGTCRSAPAALLVQTDGPAASFAHQRLDPYPKGPVAVRGFAKVQGQFTTARIAVQIFDGSWKQLEWKDLAALSAGDDWQEFTATMVLPDNAAHALLGVSFDGNGKIWLDDLIVTGEGGAGQPAPGEPKPSSAAAAAPAPPVVPADPPAAAPLPLSVPASDSRLHYVGRFDRTDPSAPRAAWSASAVQLRFVGSAVNAVLDGGNDNRFVAVIDGKAGRPFYVRRKKTIAIASGLPETLHSVEIVKITEPIFGTVAFHGFELSANAQAFPAPPAQRRIEVIGDSISCGYGNEAPNEKEHFSHATENAYQTYSAMAARRLNADLQVIAWSGKLMAPNNTLPEMYDRALPQNPNSVADDASWRPDAVIINLGTNDFAGHNPEEEMWVRSYRAFITRLRTKYPQAAIFCSIGPMLSDDYSPSKSALSTCRKYLQRIVKEANDSGDRQVYFLEFPMQTGRLGFGADWHPSIRQHEAMADVLVPALREKLNWPAAAGSR